MAVLEPCLKLKMAFSLFSHLLAGNGHIILDEGDARPRAGMMLRCPLA
jgi:hypothetical protein